MPLPIGLRGLVVPRVGLAPTSSGLQPDAWTRSATEANGGRGGSRTHMLLLARQVPSRLGHTPELVHEVGLEPTSPGSEPGLLPDYITRDQWRKRQDSNLRNRRGRSTGLATRRDQPLRHASDWRKRRDSNPRDLFGPPVFETGAFNHSATLPDGADDGSRTRTCPVDSRGFCHRTPSAWSPRHDSNVQFRVRSPVRCPVSPRGGGVADGTCTHVPGFTVPCSGSLSYGQLVRPARFELASPT